MRRHGSGLTAQAGRWAPTQTKSAMPTEHSKAQQASRLHTWLVTKEASLEMLLIVTSSGPLAAEPKGLTVSVTLCAAPQLSGAKVRLLGCRLPRASSAAGWAHARGGVEWVWHHGAAARESGKAPASLQPSLPRPHAPVISSTCTLAEGWLVRATVKVKGPAVADAMGPSVVGLTAKGAAPAGMADCGCTAPGLDCSSRSALLLCRQGEGGSEAAWMGVMPPAGRQPAGPLACLHCSNSRPDQRARHMRVHTHRFE